MCECAERVAPAIAERLPALRADAARAALLVLGSVGAGYEACIAEQIAAADERSSREALRALARIGSAKAAAIIVSQIEKAAGRTVDATRSVDPDLVGGFVLQAGSFRVDASVRGRLQRLRHELARS